VNDRGAGSQEVSKHWKCKLAHIVRQRRNESDSLQDIRIFRHCVANAARPLQLPKLKNRHTRTLHVLKVEVLPAPAQAGNQEPHRRGAAQALLQSGDGAHHLAFCAPIESVPVICSIARIEPGS
jgi:hypothetical protein